MKWMGEKARKEGRIRQGETHVWIKGDVSCFHKRCFHPHLRSFHFLKGKALVSKT
jgi:hypothetical protein